MKTFSIRAVLIAFALICLCSISQPVNGQSIGQQIVFTAHPGKGQELLTILSSATKIMQNYPGCQLYVVQHLANNSDVVFVTEVWDNLAAFHSAIARDDMAALIQRAIPLVAKNDTFVTTPVIGKGLP